MRATFFAWKPTIKSRSSSDVTWANLSARLGCAGSMPENGVRSTYGDSVLQCFSIRASIRLDSLGTHFASRGRSDWRASTSLAKRLVWKTRTASNSRLSAASSKAWKPEPQAQCAQNVLKSLTEPPRPASIDNEL